jgi:hypothetical protein
MTPEQIAQAVVDQHYPAPPQSFAVQADIKRMIADGIERALAEQAEASAPLRQEIADAVLDYQRVFPPPHGLAPNLDLAVRAAAILSGHDKPEDWFSATTDKGDTIRVHRPSYDVGWHDHDEEFLAGELNG